MNTGRKIFTNLIEVFADTGLPTGNVKPNTPGDPDYIAPIEDLIACPLTTTTTSTTTTTTTIAPTPPVAILTWDDNTTNDRLCTSPVCNYQMIATLSDVNNDIVSGAVEMSINLGATWTTLFTTGVSTTLGDSITTGTKWYRLRVLDSAGNQTISNILKYSHQLLGLGTIRLRRGTTDYSPGATIVVSVGDQFPASFIGLFKNIHPSQTVQLSNHITTPPSFDAVKFSSLAGLTVYGGPVPGDLLTNGGGTQPISFDKDSSGSLQVRLAVYNPTTPTVPTILTWTVNFVDFTDGGCPTLDMPINVGPHMHLKAGELKLGDLIYTNKEGTNEFGYFKVISNTQTNQPCLRVVTENRAIEISKTHRFETSSGYERAENMKVGDTLKTLEGDEIIIAISPAGMKKVVNFEIEEAHTYMVWDVKSHNKTDPNGDPITTMF